MDIIYFTGCTITRRTVKKMKNRTDRCLLCYCFCWYFPVRFPQYYHHRKTKKTSLNKKLNECKVQVSISLDVHNWSGCGLKNSAAAIVHKHELYTPEKGSAAVVAVISLIIATDGCGQNESTTIWSFSSYIF